MKVHILKSKALALTERKSSNFKRVLHSFLIRWPLVFQRFNLELLNRLGRETDISFEAIAKRIRLELN